jgi:hypothetical protein
MKGIIPEQKTVPPIPPMPPVKEPAPDAQVKRSVKIKHDGYGTAVIIDGHPIEGCSKVTVSVDVRTRRPVVTLELYADEVEIDTDGEKQVLKARSGKASRAKAGCGEG